MRRLAQYAVLAGFALIGGCSVLDDGPDGAWLMARVRWVEPLSKVKEDRLVNTSCVDQQQPDQLVAVVSYRSAHVNRYRALAVSSQEAFRAGDSVLINVRQCSLVPSLATPGK